MYEIPREGPGMPRRQAVGPIAALGGVLLACGAPPEAPVPDAGLAAKRFEELQKEFGDEKPTDKYALYKRLSKVRRTVDRK